MKLCIPTGIAVVMALLISPLVRSQPSAGMVTPGSASNTHYASAVSHQQTQFAKLDYIIEDEMHKQELIGVAIGIVEGGSIAYTKGYGFTDLSRSDPVTDRTLFRWASISKTLTAVAAFQLIERQRLSLNDLVVDHVPYWPTSRRRDEITIEHLLTHRSGINHYDDYNRAAYKANKKWNAKQSVDVFDHAALITIPGRRVCYSTFGYNLLGAVIEEASPNGYVRWVESHIKNELNLKSLTEISDSPGGYDKDCQGILDKKNEGKVLWKLPGGGWASNIKDLAAFLRGLMMRDLIKNPANMWQRPPGNVRDRPSCSPQIATTYCYGVFNQTSNGLTRISHGGAHDDVRTLMAFFPSRFFGVVLMINGGDYVDEERVFDRIANFFGYRWQTVDTSPTFTCDDDKKKCPGKFTAVWRESDSETLLRRGYDNEDFYKEWKELTGAGYVCTDFDTYLTGTVRKWDAVFQKDQRESAIRRDRSSKEFSEIWQNLSDKGFRLIDIETYKDGFVRKWAGLFVEGSGGHALFRDLNIKAFGDKHTELKEKGYQLIDVETYLKGTKRNWAGVWRSGAGRLLNRGFRTDEFVDLVIERRDGGFKLLDVETYKDGTVRKWAGVWEESATSQRFHYNAEYCNMMTNEPTYRAAGLELIDFEKY